MILMNHISTYRTASRTPTTSFRGFLEADGLRQLYFEEGMPLHSILRIMVEQDASDLFLKVGAPPLLRINGSLVPSGDRALTHAQLMEMAAELMGSEREQRFAAERELNFAFERDGLGRFRVNVLSQRSSIALVIRRIKAVIPTLEELHLPVEVLTRLMQEQHGLILVTGSTGAGKSTTVAAMLEFVNQTSPKHIVTLEDPIEFQFEERQAMINQREVGVDTHSFSEGLKNILRQSPDLLFVSDIRDRETMESCVLAAEAGQLVVSCIHTINAVTTIERLVAFVPSTQQALLRLRLSLILRGIMSLRLLRRQDGMGRIPACEMLVATPTIRELIREGRTEQLSSFLYNGGMYGMQTFTQALYHRYRRGEVELDEALRYADCPEELQLAIREIRATSDVPSRIL